MPEKKQTNKKQKTNPKQTNKQKWNMKVAVIPIVTGALGTIL